MQITKERTNNIELRSEEIQEIIGQTPSWIIRWGITAILVVFVFVAISSWFIKYPDIIRAKVLITTTPPVITLLSQTSGPLILTKPENTPVREGEVIGYISSDVSLQDLQRLEIQLATLLNNHLAEIPDNLRLGQLQDAFNDFLNASDKLSNFYSLDQGGALVAQLSEQVEAYQQMQVIFREQSSLAKQEASLIHDRYKMDSILFATNLIPRAEYLTAEINYVQNIRVQKNARITEASENLKIQEYKSQIVNMNIGRKETESTLKLAYLNSLRILKMRIAKWKSEYVFYSPCDGTLAYLDFLEDKIFVEVGKELFSVVPKTGHIYARAEIPIAGSGKLARGQRVNIRLDNYPSEQYGILEGIISDISIVPNGDKYLARIELANSMTTSLNRQLPFKQYLQGSTEIITEDLRLFDRVFFQLRKLFND